MIQKMSLFDKICQEFFLLNQVLTKVLTKIVTYKLLILLIKTVNIHTSITHYLGFIFKNVKQKVSYLKM